LEEYRAGNAAYYVRDGKPEGVAAEFADVLIRIGDFCGGFGIDLERAVREKLAYNRTRPHRHGGKLA
jgi:NTP pyrophosphatase (non-canonical NTP hydrolase)